MEMPSKAGNTQKTEPKSQMDDRQKWLVLVQRGRNMKVDNLLLNLEAAMSPACHNAQKYLL